MARCQWCRQESTTADICEWCKRPMTAGWTPTAAPVAVPADKTSFIQDDELDRNDRILMFSMVGVVLLTGIAFGVNFLNKKSMPPPPPTPPPVYAPQQPSSPQSNIPSPAPQAPRQDVTEPYYPPAPQPTVDTYTPPPTTAAAPPPAHPPGPAFKNPKMGLYRDVTSVD